MAKEFYIELAASTNSLEHHGVKGQQWGVRNGPPYPIEDKVLKKVPNYQLRR